MNIKLVFLSASMLSFFCCQGQGKKPAHDPSGTNEELVPDVLMPGQSRLKGKMKFNYTFLRLSYPLSTVAGFHNPLYGPLPTVSDNKDVSGEFDKRNDMKTNFKIGLEVGAVKHIKAWPKTSFFKLGVNYCINAQFYSFKKNETVPGTQVVSQGLGLINITVGPQATFIPVRDVKVGAFFRLGIGGVIGDYKNTHIDPVTGVMDRQLDIEMYNIAFEKEIGIDISYKKLGLGINWCFMKAAPRTGNVFSKDDADVNAYYSTSTLGLVPVNPKISYSRLNLNIGFAF